LPRDNEEWEPSASILIGAILSEYGEMDMNRPSTRLLGLLSHLVSTRFKSLPKGVGLKTALQARELGFIEFDRGDLRSAKYRLTEIGLAYRRSIRGGVKAGTRQFGGSSPQQNS
jgi:hypothetical protein